MRVKNIPNLNKWDVLKTLELDLVLSKVAELTVSSRGSQQIQNLSFIINPELLKKELRLVTEMRDLLSYDDPLPFNSFSDFISLLEKLKIEGAILREEEFLALKNFLNMVRKVKMYFCEKEEYYPLIYEKLKNWVPIPEFEKEIDKLIDQNGIVRDKASNDLFKIRKDIERKTSEVRKRLMSILQTMVSKDYAQEDFLMLRNGQLVIPMKESHAGRLKGIVVDQSISGATLFVEPLEVLEINNEIRRCKSQQKQEIERILKALTDKIRKRRIDIEKNLKEADELDSIMARARFSIKIDGNPAQIGEDGILEFKNARHPILLLKLDKEKVIPLSIRMGNKINTLIITGPNAGGKTVALKTIGLLVLMHQIGLHIPVDEGTQLPIFSSVFADIGDQQSIEQDLSTFSSHMKNIKIVIQEADEKSLVLLDEIGSATDPIEGASLATAILRDLTKKQVFTIATTHMGALKVFANEEPSVENASMAFDKSTFNPTYRLQMGIPGSSYAFEIAERLGISKDIISDAKKNIGDERGKLDKLILHLETELQNTHKLLEEAEIKESKLTGLINLYQERIDHLKTEGEERKKQIVKEAEEVLQEANVLVERVVREIREDNANRQVILKAKHDIKSQKEKLQDLSKVKSKKPYVFSIGDWVKWRGHHGVGQVISKSDNAGRICVQWNDLKLRISSVELLPGEKIIKKSVGMTKYQTDKEVSDELDLRGLSVDEAIDLVDKYLSDVVLIGYSNVRIIHGKGTGMLRKEVGRHLKEHAFIKSQRYGNWNEGDTGVTIVELK
jgi:DNA mismatch repair protein MutS2